MTRYPHIDLHSLLGTLFTPTTSKPEIHRLAGLARPRFVADAVAVGAYAIQRTVQVSLARGRGNGNHTGEYESVHKEC